MIEQIKQLFQRPNFLHYAFLFYLSRWVGPISSTVRSKQVRKGEDFLDDDAKSLIPVPQTSRDDMHVAPITNTLIKQTSYEWGQAITSIFCHTTKERKKRTKIRWSIQDYDYCTSEVPSTSFSHRYAYHHPPPLPFPSGVLFAAVFLWPVGLLPALPLLLPARLTHQHRLWSPIEEVKEKKMKN